MTAEAVQVTVEATAAAQPAEKKKESSPVVDAAYNLAAIFIYFFAFPQRTGLGKAGDEYKHGAVIDGLQGLASITRKIKK